MKRNLRKTELWIYAAFAVFYIWLAAQLPYTHDDWDWGLPVGIQQLVTANLNSRYVGNFFEVIMTRSELAKTAIIGVGFFLLPLVIARAVSREPEDRMAVFLLSNILILSMDSYIWRQTYGWIAGYANFGLSAVFLVVILGRFLPVFDEVPRESGKLSGEILALSGLCLAGQLFIENIAIFVFLMSALVNGIYWYRTRRISREYLGIFIAACIGLGIMFSSSIFRSLWSTGEAVDGYRQMFVNADADLISVIRQCLQQCKALPYRVWINNRYICLAISVLMSILLLQKDSAKGWLKNVCCVVNGCIIAFLLQNIYVGQRAYMIIGAVFFAVTTLELVILFLDNKLLLLRMLFAWLSPLCVILPVMVTTELGERLFFTSNVLLTLFAGLLLSVCGGCKGRKANRNALLLGIVLILVAQYSQIYYAIGAAKEERTALIEHAVAAGVEEITIPRYPNQEYLWYPEPQTETRESFFKEFYQIPQDVSVVFE